MTSDTAARAAGRGSKNESSFRVLWSRVRGTSSVRQQEPRVKSAPLDSEESKVLLSHNDDWVAFELTWQLLQEGQRQKLQSKALADGYTHVVIGLESDLMGFLKLSPSQREKKPIYSAALLLSETVSLGGDEVFVFRVDETRHALVALKNSMPVPGFDLIGQPEMIADAARSYLSLPHKNEVRRCGDAEILSGAEFFEFAAALAGLDRNQPRVKAIPDMRKIFLRVAILALFGLVALSGWMGWSYFESKAEAERLQRENDPNAQYERNYETSAASIKGLGTPGLKAFVATLSGIPLEIAGWSLSNVVCQSGECLATWARQSGNFADFDEKLPPEVKQKPDYGFIAGDVKGTQLKTRHPVAAVPDSDAASAGKLRREALPGVPQVQSEFVSRLQDYSLIDARVQVAAPVPFPTGVTDIAPIFKPVVSGTWSMELPLWSMDSLVLPDYVLVETLSIDLPPKAEVAKGVKHYKLTGKYYAKGKTF
ncbi:type 4b pilus protein PilO2 [Leptothrix sp. BB-4]